MDVKKKYNEIDKNILSLFDNDKDAAFRLLYDTYYLPLCLYSIQITGTSETSEDLVQSLFVDFWDREIYKKIETNLHAWLFTAIRYSSITYIQRKKYFPLDDSYELSYSPIDEFYNEEDLLEKRKNILIELKKLPIQEYNVLTKIILEGKKYKEVADELGISLNTVKTHLSRGLKKLRGNESALIFLLLYYSN